MEPVKVGKPASEKNAISRVTAVVIAVIAVSTAALILTGSVTRPTINITVISLQIGYGSASESYFGNQVQQVPSNYGSYFPGENVTYSLAFHNSGNITHSVTAIFVKAQGFNVVYENPSLPVPVSPGHTSYIQVSIQVPSQNFAGILDVYAVVQ